MAEDDAPTPNTAAKIVRETMLRVAQLRRQLFRQLQSRGSVNAELQREMQAAISEYYFALRPYRDADAIRDKWQTAKLYRENGEWVVGIDHLDDWVYRKREAETQPRKRGAEPSVDYTTEQMAPVTQLRVTSALDDMAAGLGLGMDVSSGPRPAALLPKEGPKTAEEAATDGGETE